MSATEQHSVAVSSARRFMARFYRVARRRRVLRQSSSPRKRGPSDFDVGTGKGTGSPLSRRRRLWELAGRMRIDRIRIHLREKPRLRLDALDPRTDVREIAERQLR